MVVVSTKTFKRFFLLCILWIFTRSLSSPTPQRLKGCLGFSEHSFAECITIQQQKNFLNTCANSTSDFADQNSLILPTSICKRYYLLAQVTRRTQKILIDIYLYLGLLCDSFMKELPQQVTNPTDVAELTRRLVQIPSYVNVRDPKTNELVPEAQRVDERGVATYIADFLRQHTNLTVRTQDVVDGRFNVIAANSDKPKLVLLGHTDTVKPSEGGTYDQLAAEVHDGKIYGLGAADMKSGVASILSAISLFEDLPDVMLAFYIDEEYDFAGMRAMLKDMPTGVNPELMLSGDGGDLELANACKGLIEVHGTMRGTSAHAATPDLGVNAINGVVDAFKILKKRLGKYSHESLGKCTVNLARLDGGKAGTNEKGEQAVVEQINAVPDIARFKVDIRTSSPNVKPELVIADILAYCKKHRLSVEGLRIYHDLGAWFTDPSELDSVVKIVEDVTGRPVKFSDPQNSGYVDLQMLWNTLGRPTGATMGPGPGKVMHMADEYVAIDDLIKCRD